jgi:hypothetical protein
MDQDDIDWELVELARDWMDVSKLKNLSGSKGNRCVCNTCPILSMPIEATMWILAGIHNMEGVGWMQLDRCC